MPFQTVVGAAIPAGYIGEPALDGPTRAQPAYLSSATPANNIVGRAFTVESGATGQPLAGDNGANPAPLKVTAGGAGVFAGILGHPKAYAAATLFGDGSQALANGVAVELFQEHPGLFLQLPAAAAVGDYVYFTTADGSLVTAGPGANAPAGANTRPVGEVTRYTGITAGVGLYVVRLGEVQRPSATA